MGMQVKQYFNINYSTPLFLLYKNNQKVVNDNNFKLKLCIMQNDCYIFLKQLLSISQCTSVNPTKVFRIRKITNCRIYRIVEQIALLLRRND